MNNTNSNSGVFGMSEGVTTALVVVGGVALVAGTVYGGYKGYKLVFKDKPAPAPVPAPVPAKDPVIAGMSNLIKEGMKEVTSLINSPEAKSFVADINKQIADISTEANSSDKQ
jgi:hypothetical protein